MPKFRKKPIIIEATQWFKNGDHPEDIPEGSIAYSEGKIVGYYLNPSLHGKKLCLVCHRSMHNHGWIDTREGGHIVCPGDWIITGIQGEHYPCKPDIFTATYEPVSATGEKENA